MATHPNVSRIVRRTLVVALIVLVPAYGALLFAVNRAMHQSPEQFGRFMSHMPGMIFLVAPFETLWTHARAGHLNLGDAAPDFTLPTLDHSSQVTLASFRNSKPVVLVFGSYT
jgi:hypothetical protein